MLTGICQDTPHTIKVLEVWVMKNPHYPNKSYRKRYLLIQFVSPVYRKGLGYAPANEFNDRGCFVAACRRNEDTLNHLGENLTFSIKQISLTI